MSKIRYKNHPQYKLKEIARGLRRWVKIKAIVKNVRVQNTSNRGTNRRLGLDAGHKIVENFIANHTYAQHPQNPHKLLVANPQSIGRDRLLIDENKALDIIHRRQKLKPHLTTFVVRLSPTIESDIQRGWSGWVGGEKKLKDFAFFDQFDDLGDKSDDDLIVLAKKHNADLRFDGRFWREFHHEGLSSYRLESDTPEKALKELREGIASQKWRFDFGDATVGEINYLAELGRNTHLLAVEDTEPET